ncbi:Alpha-maltose-1-phosphate synthase [BD1-7 clade bacterium]|uniref:Alpha-maltose-1-phosphate synthase n=1 Tax=BD1-7 clade bacterium TaxID=2029982 RepID=A0A5S9QZM0_9GAMM|nr:Alpha-maltose-1-phosphate synthase [BD1-7 clade bacterium]
MKVLHVLYNYFPDHTGSTIRSEGVLSGQKAIGIEVVAITSPFQSGFSDAEYETVEGVKVYRAKNVICNELDISEKPKSLWSRVKKLRLLLSFARYIREVAEKEQVDVIHAHSMFFCAFAAKYASKTLGIPMVYEFRSLWEERSKNQGIVSKYLSKLLKFSETLAMRAADHVVTINQGLKSNIVKRGIRDQHVTVVSNAVSSSLLSVAQNTTSSTSFCRFGYVGNFSDIEGLDLLLEAFSLSFPVDGFPDVSLSFWGRGPDLEYLSALAESKNDPRIKFCGPFSRDSVTLVYESLDCIVIPRISLPITELVTPLKPLEAMAFGRLVIGSDVGGIVEVVGGSENALLFPAGDTVALSSQLSFAHENIEPCLRTLKCGRDFVFENRNWSEVSRAYSKVYQDLLVG